MIERWKSFQDCNYQEIDQCNLAREKQINQQGLQLWHEWKLKKLDTRKPTSQEDEDQPSQEDEQSQEDEPSQKYEDQPSQEDEPLQDD